MLESGSSGSGLGRYAVLRCHMTPLRSRVMITSNLVEYDYRLVPRAFSSTIFKMAASHFEKWRRPGNEVVITAISWEEELKIPLEDAL